MSTSSDSSDFNKIKWGALSAAAIAILAIFGAEIVVWLAVSLMVYLGQDITFMVALVEVENLLTESLTLFFAYYAITSLLTLAVVVGFIRLRGGDWSDLGFRTFKLARGIKILLLGSIGFVVAAVVIALVVEQLIPGIDMTAEQEIPFLAAEGSVEIALAFFALVIIAPVVEEAVFRGFLLPAFTRAVGAPLGVAVISLGFGLLHPPANVMIVIGIFSVFLCWVYLKTKSVWPPIVLHAGKNLIAFLSIVMMDI